MAADIGPKIGIDGEKEFRDALKSMGQQLKTLGTEMKAVTSAFDVDNDSQKKLASQSDILSRQLEVQQQRITEIQKALDYARQNYAENSNEVQRWQQSLNNATADLNNTKKQLNDLEHGVDDVGDAMDNAGQKTLSLGDILKANLLSDAIMAGIKAVASGIKSLVSGAIESYGEYEQLVGGVETLFGGSADTVIKNAENAYKTAGLSANAYMETVTSFSASLLQSMGNDTEAAAKKADQALTDMSDNANKMGTDMSSIQNAYQGFAKQNYTMLDNLKLGYGGTKEEMQRLIADANALNAAQGNYTNYSIESYADIVDAIHTVQTEMGITGTTALEASTTIEGSIGAMKAAYQNFVTGLGDQNADIGALTEQLIESAGTVAENVLPVIENVVESIVKAVQEQGPEMISKFVAYATEKLPDVLKLGLQLVLSLAKGLAQNLPQLVQGTLQMVDTIVKAFVDSLPDIIEVGKDIVRGVWEGIKAMGAWLGEKVSSFFSGIVDGVKGILGIHSPSRVFAGIGQNMALGLGQGFEKQMQSVTAGIQNAIPTPTVDTVYNAAAGMVNGLAAANAGNGGSYTINLVLQNGAQIASWLLPDIRTASKNNPEVATA
uniref:Tail tape measure protein n=1 Tax=Siphoviridae sp. ctobd83 TaxID=2825670 RepID=A0A8S5NYT6_9CAUD|nr:MAG TPA: tail tape measure protein [Siphoviridae sp. ctobd83]